jgi:hypothetical protein
METSEVFKLLSQLSLCAPMRIGLEVFTESRVGWVEGINLLIRLEAIRDAERVLSIIEGMGMSWMIVRRSEHAYLCVH